MLEKFSRYFIANNFSTLKGNMLSTCQGLRTFLTQHSPPNGNLDDPDDVYFIVSAISNYLKFADKEKGLGVYDLYEFSIKNVKVQFNVLFAVPLLLDIVNMMMNLPPSILSEAENMYGSCSLVVNIVEELSKHISNIEGQKV